MLISAVQQTRLNAGPASGTVDSVGPALGQRLPRLMFVRLNCLLLFFIQ